MNTRAFIFSALIAGLVMALLSNIPVLNFLNCILCMWVWLSGILAVFIYRRMSAANPALSVGQGAGLGAVTGIFGGLIGALLGALFTGLWASSLGLLQNQQELQPLLNSLPNAGFSFFWTLMNLALYTIFGAIGGSIATAAIWKEPRAVEG